MGLELDVGSDDDSWSSQRNLDVIEQVICKLWSDRLRLDLRKLPR